MTRRTLFQYTHARVKIGPTERNEIEHHTVIYVCSTAVVLNLFGMTEQVLNDTRGTQP